MSKTSASQQTNAQELAIAIASLRQRLERLADPSATPGSSEPHSAEATPARGAAARRRKARAISDNSPASGQAASSAEPQWALGELARRLGLSAFETNVLLLCAAPEFDTRVANACARAQDDPQKTYPTFALALALFDDPSWDVMSPERPLRYWRLIDVHQSTMQPTTASALRADERIVNYLKGLNYLDDRLSPFLGPLELEPGLTGIAPSQQEIVDQIQRRLDQADQAGPTPVVQLAGPDSNCKQLVALHVAAHYGRSLFRLPVEMLPATHSDLETLCRLWQRESRLLPLALYVDAQDLDGTAAERLTSLNRFLTGSDGLFFLGLREGTAQPKGRAHLEFDVTKPTAKEQEVAWADALSAEAADAPPMLAAQFNLSLASIQRLAGFASSEVQATQGSVSETVWDLCCASQRPRLDKLAQRLEPKMTWDDLVLPEAEMDLLRQVAAHVKHRRKVYGEWGFDRKMNRGFGISVLFAGESGCGKTMAAEVIANELRLNLYRIDLSAVVDKYIGETEKNFRRVFDAAEDGGAILFFDESDALFGKRSEVKDSHDRYANIEVNYLLQRLESYRGLAILATNMKSAMDTAFLRRLRFVVNFRFPGIADRRRLWEKAFLQQDAASRLPAPPLDTLDYSRLARLNLTGGHIHNAALHAAFLAAAAGTTVTMPLVLKAAGAEYVKLERPVNETDFQWIESNGPSNRTIAKREVCV